MAPSVSDIKHVDEVANGVSQLTLVNAAFEPSDVEAKNLDPGPSYPAYLPCFDVTEKQPPLELFEALSTDGLNELALYAAERKVLIFRDQDFKDIGFDRQIEIAKHYGPIHSHNTSGNVKGYPELHIVYADPNNNEFRESHGKDRLSKIGWHTDLTFEKQPSSTTFFFILDQPEVGGDTLFGSQVEAYNRLSAEFKKHLEGLKAVHSGMEQAEFSRKRGGVVRREPVESEHPLVRVHPVTGEKALFVNEGFTRRIVGFKKEESDWLLKFLYDHIAKGADFQIRARYEPGTVVVWDNRVTVHSINPDFAPDARRHAVRLTPRGEVPIPYVSSETA